MFDSMRHYVTTKLRNGVKRAFRSFGYEITPYPKLEGPYEKIIAKSYYAPWKTDSEFEKVYRQIQPYTLVDQHRCYELWSLVEQSAKIPGALIEVGVWRGGTGGLISARAANLGITDPVYLCDTFKGVVKTSKCDLHYDGGEHSDTSLEIVGNLLQKKLLLNNTRILEGIFPEETASKIETDQFRFCHIDVDVYESTKDIVDWIWPRMSIGGIVVFDDYGLPSCTGIRDYINERKNLPDCVLIHNINGHAVWVKTASSQGSLAKSP